MTRRFLNYIFLLSFLNFNCGKTDRVDTKTVNEELKRREIKRVTPIQIIETGVTLGNEDSKKLVECFNKKDTLQFDYLSCFSNERSRAIKGIKLYKPKSHLPVTKSEQDFIDAYNHSLKGNHTISPFAQDLKDGTLLYALPVYFVLNNGKETLTTTASSPADFGIVFVYYHRKEVVLSIP